ncbi:MAG: hypothetical protein KME18_21385 [Phormidium tanganyikae FI6-MK23]|jgi:hypothetical protein|nr:hypothetical protein [Phormidium tanganyikae FI6-MK23]
MPFPKSAQSKGGKAPASACQKQTARAWLQQHQPWSDSTGPKSQLGKISAKYNAVRPGAYQRFVKSWKEDFEQGCLEAEQAIAAFEVDQALHPADYDSLTVKRYWGQDSSGNRWCFYVVYVTFIGTEATTQARRAIAETIRNRFHSAGKSVDRVLLSETPVWLIDCLAQLDALSEVERVSNASHESAKLLFSK